MDAFDCHFQGRFIFDNEKDIQEAKSNGIEDLNKKYELIEIVKGESIFCATAITDTMNMKGVISEGNSSFVTETLVTHKRLNNKYFDIKKNKLILKHK
mgnify:FL=1